MNIFWKASIVLNKFEAMYSKLFHGRNSRFGTFEDGYWQLPYDIKQFFVWYFGGLMVVCGQAVACKAQIPSPDWGRELTLASGCRTGSPSYIG